MRTHSIAHLASFVLLAATNAVAQGPVGVPLNTTLTFRNPRLLQVGDTVHAFGDAGGATSLYCRSGDGGRSWPIVEQSLGAFLPTDEAYADGLLVSVGRGFGGIGVAGPAVTISTDLGLTWSPVQTVAVFEALSNTPFAPEEVRVHVAGQAITLVWAEPATKKVRTARSANAGATWSSASVLYQPPTPPAPWISSSPLHLQVVRAGSTVHTCWIADLPMPVTIRMQTSTDAGATWLANDRLVGVPAVFGNVLLAAGDADQLLVGPRAGTIFRSADGGVSWQVVTGLPTPNVEHIASDGDRVVLTGITPDVFFPTRSISTSLDGGVTWQPHWVANTFSGFVATAFSGSSDLHVLFSFPNVPSFGLLLRSADDGVSWSEVASNIAGFAPGPHRHVHLRRVTTGLPTDYVWYAYVGLGWTPAGAGTAGTGGLVPQLALQGKPALGRTPTLALTQALGNTLGVLGVSSAPPGAIPFAGGLVRLQAPLALVPFATSALGAWTAPLAVPNDPALSGASLVAQSLLIDPAATDGLSLSSAIELWLAP